MAAPQKPEGFAGSGAAAANHGTDATEAGQQQQVGRRLRNRWRPANRAVRAARQAIHRIGRIDEKRAVGSVPLITSGDESSRRVPPDAIWMRLPFSGLIRLTSPEFMFATMRPFRLASLPVITPMPSRPGPLPQRSCQFGPGGDVVREDIAGGQADRQSVLAVDDAERAGPALASGSMSIRPWVFV